jgi:hypothetical protein
MPDYECPTCGGGFPSAAADGDCPWCGEDMAGNRKPSIGAPIGTVPTNTTAGSRLERATAGTTRPLSDELQTTSTEFQFGGDSR